MPPGSKKRRAAKKKMENQSNNHSNPSSAYPHSHGNKFVKHHDEKDNDVGEVSSPRSQDHRHNNPSTERLKINDTVVHVERNFKMEGELVRKNGRVVEHDESMTKSDNGMSLNSSGRSSNVEVHGISNSRATEDQIYTPSEAIQSVPIEHLKVGLLPDAKYEKKSSRSDENEVSGSFERNAKTLLEQKVLILHYDNGVEQDREFAAKKKMENQSNNRSNPSSAYAHSHGNKFVKHHDEKDNDVGEVSSPQSQDHRHNNPSTERLKINDTVVHVERNFKMEGELVRKNGRVVEHDESMTKSDNGMSLNSSGRSSNVEFHGISNSQAKENQIHTLSEDIQSVPIEEVKRLKVGFFLDEQNEIKSSHYDEYEFGASIESNAKTVFEQKVFATQETDDSLSMHYDNRVAQDREFAANESLLVPSPCPDDQIYTLSEAIQSVPIEEVKHLKVGFFLDEKNEKKNSHYDEYEFGASFESNAITVFEQKVFSTQEPDDTLSLHYDNRVEQDREFAATETLLVPSPCPEKKTSWRSCCGMFEVFSGSGR